MTENYVELIEEIGEGEFLTRFAELQKQVNEFWRLRAILLRR